MQQSIGAVIRRLRRERNMTQSELGGTAFSKSYVSAVEREKLAPSREALQHFALCLGKPEQYFLLAVEQTSEEPAFPLIETMDAPGAIGALTHENIALLATFLDHPEYTETHLPEVLPGFSAEILEMLSLSDQAHYYYVQSLLAQEKREASAAIQALEQALAREGHQNHTAAILYGLGKCYLQVHLPELALHYAERARLIVSQQGSIDALSSLPFLLALQSGQIYLELDRYQQALDSFEQARACLNAQQPIQRVGLLYWGLGYATYALAYQQTSSSHKDEREEQANYLYQRAQAYLVQSLTLAQMAGSRQEARDRRLTLAMVQLDWAIWQRRCIRLQEGAGQPARSLQQASLSTLLDEASEQCRQALASSREKEIVEDANALDRVAVICIALALFIRIGVQRALLASDQAYEHTLQREQALVSAFCQQALDACTEETLLDELTWQAGNSAEMSVPFSPPSLPRLPAFPPSPTDKRVCPAPGQAEIYFAAGEVAEMLGRTATNSAFISSCYARADQCFLLALEEMRRACADHQLHPGHLTRAAQRYLILLAERLNGEPDSAEQYASQVARSLLTLCQEQLLNEPPS